jgi:hypothetical protein
MNQTSPQQQTDPSLSPPPKLFAVSLVTGEIWQLGAPVPGSELTRSRGQNGQELEGTEGQQALIIMEMFPNDDGSIEVYASPVPGSAFDRQQTGAIFAIYPLTIARTLTVARFDVWKEMLTEAQEEALDDGEDPDPDPDPDLPSNPELGAAPTANGLPVAGGEVGGAGVTP